MFAFILRGRSSESRSSNRPPIGLAWRSSKWFILFTVCFAVFTDIFLYSLIIPVIPFSLQGRVQIGADEVGKWVSVLIAVYGGALAATSPLMGWIADHTSTRQAPFMTGLLFLAAGTLMLHLGRSLPVLVVGRIVQGSSASVVWIVGLALLADTINADEIGQSMGYVFLATSLGVLLGPLLGGIIFDRTSYDAVFAVAYAVIGTDVLLRLAVIEKKEAIKWIHTDDNGDSLHSKALENGSVERDPVVPDAEDTEITQEKALKRKRPAIVTLLKSARLLASLWGTVIVALLTTAFEATLPLYTKEIWSWTSTPAALLFLAMIIPSFIGPLIGAVSDKIGARWLATAGFLILVPAEACLRFVDHNTIQQKVLLVALLVLFGTSLNLVMTPVMAEITLVVQTKVDKNPDIFGKKGAYAQAYGLFNFAYALGTLIGPLWGGLIREAAGWGTMAWTLALVSGISAIITAIWCGGAIYKKKVDISGRESET